MYTTLLPGRKVEVLWPGGEAGRWNLGIYRGESTSGSCVVEHIARTAYEEVVPHRFFVVHRNDVRPV